MEKTVPFSEPVRSGCKMMAILLGVLVITLPVAIWFWRKQAKGKLVLREEGVEVNGLGLGATEWKFSDIERIGVLKRRVPNAGIGGVIAAKMCGGKEAVNLCAKMRDGKTKFFMLSRYQNHPQLLEQIQAASNLPLETVTQGMGGPKFAN